MYNLLKQMKTMTVALLLLFSINSEADLSKSTQCTNEIIAASLYQVTFEPYSWAYGPLELWMVFNIKGMMVPSKFWYSYDGTLQMANDIVLFKSKKRTKLVVGTLNSNKAKGCFAETKLTGRSYNNDQSTYVEFEVEGSGFISRHNTSQFYSDADYFTLNNAKITYGGVTGYGKMTFTQIR